MQDDELHVYPLFVALTRPPMLMGVTQTFFIINFVTCFSILILSKNPIISIPPFFMLHIVGFLGCKKDYHFFEIILGKAELYCPNNKYWGCNSYDPE
ncbi:MAG: hypothetical protein EPO11_02405 [Gammaproteobacteria bacterium]|nr:MAG: hypothetical protein EPO11_02405 [Gammaproteobacteria bacterium]